MLAPDCSTLRSWLDAKGLGRATVRIINANACLLFRDKALVIGPTISVSKFAIRANRTTSGTVGTLSHQVSLNLSYYNWLGVSHTHLNSYPHIEISNSTLVSAPLSDPNADAPADGSCPNSQLGRRRCQLR